ncbi:unnamed protein product [Citrullus colocynthis]|uniref:Uncharacterized protein n=1 Tax=Citrullus colocynthis TaxID=252529 RepID=A0ABP0Y7A3_9ROSI
MLYICRVTTYGSEPKYIDLTANLIYFCKYEFSAKLKCLSQLKMSYIVGNGRSLSFWKDVWAGDVIGMLRRNLRDTRIDEFASLMQFLEAATYTKDLTIVDKRYLFYKFSP